MGYFRLGWFRSQEELRLTLEMGKSSSLEQESLSSVMECIFLFVDSFFFGDSSFVSLLLLFLVAFSLLPPLPFRLAFSHVGLCYGVR